MGKAKPKKHTASEIAGKIAAATTNKGGGSAGLVDRLGGKAGHSKYECHVCAMRAPDMKTMQVTAACSSQTLRCYARAAMLSAQSCTCALSYPGMQA